MDLSRGRSWCFTINNYNDDELQKLHSYTSTLGGSENGVKEIGWQEEVGESGTPHIQGYIVFINAKSFSATKKILGNRCHLEKCRNLQASRNYCKKSEGQIEGSSIVAKNLKPVDQILKYIYIEKKEHYTMEDVVDTMNYCLIKELIPFMRKDHLIELRDMIYCKVNNNFNDLLMGKKLKMTFN